MSIAFDIPVTRGKTRFICVCGEFYSGVTSRGGLCPLCPLDGSVGALRVLLLSLVCECVSDPDHFGSMAKYLSPTMGILCSFSCSHEAA